MARRPRLFAPGLLYHVIVRGNQRRKTFLGDSDYQAYLRRLGRYRERYGFTIHAYCLMPNHVHLLVESSEYPLGKFMQGLQQSYSQYFNLNHRKAGHVFQGRYKAIVCDKDEYLFELILYIHLNPVRAGIVKTPERYPYSGHRAYLDGKPSEIVDPKKVLNLMGGKSRYRGFIQDGIKEGHKDEYYEVADQRFLGNEGFGQRLQEEQEEHRPKKRRAMDAVIRALGRALEIGVGGLRSPDRSWAVSRLRAQIGYVLVRRLGYPLTEVSRYLKRDAATVGVLIGRLVEKAKTDDKLRRDIERLTRMVSK